ncbi:sulfatase-like hydrolase/transferase [Halobellus inordinatus]|uniref:sulfatase-like hydrolase/transferase n=1 Tax=Halobellus inordinatus TaxID=1126236 RepID=UPI002115A74B|nr:sulfatase-like hydrolase/transferase [Halobellus ramosii]
MAWWQGNVYGGRENRLKAATGSIKPPQREVDTFENLYAGEIRYADSLVETLRAQGQWEDTVFVLFGDHGDSFGDGGVFGHQYFVHNSIIRVPSLVRDPTGTLESGVVESLVSLVDLYPTILSLSDV